MKSKDDQFSPVPREEGVLYLVATPIGNLSDLTSRARNILEKADVIAAEDTRRTGLLLHRLSIKKKLESYREHNKIGKGIHLINLLKSGQQVVLVSDAGTPCISDPGNELVKSCAAEKIRVVSIPGPCAAICAASGSDLDISRFVFEGFLPVKGKLRKERLAGIASECRTIILYESPHRIRRTLADLLERIPKDRKLILARELTKIHEEFIRLTLEEAVSLYKEIEPVGEYVLVIEGTDEYQGRQKAPCNPGDDEILRWLQSCDMDAIPLKKQAAMLAERTGITRNCAYDFLLTKRKKNGKIPPYD